MTTNRDNKRLTPKQLAFCQKVLGGLNLSDAYRAAYSAANMLPATVNRAATELADNPKVAAMLADLRGGVSAAVVKTAAHTLDAAMKEAGSLLVDAQTRGQISAGVQAAKLRAQLAGLLSEKREESKSALTDVEVADLLKMRDEVNARIKVIKDALEMAGEMVDPVVEAPPAFRRVIQ